MTEEEKREFVELENRRLQHRHQREGLKRGAKYRQLHHWSAKDEDRYHELMRKSYKKEVLE